MRVIALVFVATSLFAQQTGTMVGSMPGSGVGRSLRAVQTPPRKATCNAPASAASMPDLPDMVFKRSLDDLVCLRHPDGNSELVLHGGPWMALAPDGDKLAYWKVDKHELHIYSITARTNTLVDTLPAATMQTLTWSNHGSVVQYTLRGIAPAGTRTFDLETGKREILPVTSPVRRIDVAKEMGGVLGTIPNLDSADYSPNGHMIGVLAVNADAPGNTASDDEPDCTGGAFTLYAYDVAAKKLMKIPFPKGFDSVLDYSFSPDDHSIAVTYGAEACDYPGDVARVYLVSLPDLTLKPLSPENRLSVKAQWTPDSKSVVYSDYTGSNSPLLAVDLATAQRVVLTSPGESGPDEILGWHTPHP